MEEVRRLARDRAVVAVAPVVPDDDDGVGPNHKGWPSWQGLQRPLPGAMAPFRSLPELYLFNADSEMPAQKGTVDAIWGGARGGVPKASRDRPRRCAAAIAKETACLRPSSNV